MFHSSACYEFSVNPLFRYMQANKIVFGLTLTFLGVILGLFGKRLFKTAICLVSALAITVLLSLFMFTVLFSRDSSPSNEWIVFGVCATVGVCLGLVLAMFSHIGISIVGAWGGVCVGLILYNAFLYKLDNDSKVAFWVTLVLLGITAAVLATKLFNHALIIGTSIAGAYAMVRGFSLIVGGFPDEMELYYLIKMGQFERLNPVFYIFFAVFIILSIFFSVFQYRKYRHYNPREFHSSKSHPYHMR